MENTSILSTKLELRKKFHLFVSVEQSQLYIDLPSQISINQYLSGFESAKRKLYERLL
jgi:hypothetical protein